MLPDVEFVPFGDLEALREKLATRRFAAFFVEPLQAEGGIRIPPHGYLSSAQSLCERNGSLLVLDEVQTGMGRTGSFLAAHQHQVQPHMVLLAKALSGGLIPVSAALMSDDIYDAVYSSVKRAIVHTSTFSENALAMRAGIATLEVLEREGLAKRAARLGAQLQDRLRDQLGGYEMVKEVRGMGLLNGIEFTAPQSLGRRAMFETFGKLHPALFGQALVMRLFREHNILTQICGNHFLVLKAAPPLIVSEEQLERFVRAIRETVEQAHSSASFWTEPLGIARRALNL
jgi:ornithine--oxo-acid transaminase